MPMLIRTQEGSPGKQIGSVLALYLTRADIALIIDALLQAEMTLPLIDPRYREMKSIDHLRIRQLALADRLEELIANENSP